MATKNDFVTDQNPDILIHLHEQDGLVPDYVSTSDVITEDDCESLMPNAFADPFSRQHPCHTKAACWLSAAYCAAKREDSPVITGNIEKFASMHGIEEDVQRVRQHFDSLFEKAAAATVAEEEPAVEKFAMVIDYNGANGRGEEGIYPLNTEWEIVGSSEQATRDYHNGMLPLPLFVKVAQAIMEESGAVDPRDIDQEVRLYGTPRLPDPYGMETLVMMRKNAGVEPEPYLSLIQELQPAIVKSASVNDALEAAAQLAEGLFNLDLQNNISYGPNTQDPYRMLYTGPTVADMEKHAATTVNIMNVPVPVTDILNMSDKRVDQLFAAGAASVIKEAKAILEGAPAMEKSAAAAEKIATLNSTEQTIYLKELAGTAW
jgi:hypothetical protein